MSLDASVKFALPDDAERALLVGRVWRGTWTARPLSSFAAGEVFDISKTAPTVRDLLEANDPAGSVRDAGGESLGPLDEILAASPRESRKPGVPWLLAPIDLQAIKAAGVTFAVSMLERVIEEQARGAPGEGRRDPRRDRGADRRRSRQAQAGLGAGDGAEEAPDREAHVVAISRGRHRPRRRDLHQGAADGGGRPPRRGRHPPDVDLEQPGARGRARRQFAAARSSARRSATTSISATSRAARRSSSARPRTTMPAPRSGRSSACSTGDFSLDDVRAGRGRADGRGRGRLPPARVERDVEDQPRSGRSRRRHHRRQPPVSRRRRALSRHHVRAGRGPRRARDRASPTRSATSSPSPRRGSDGSRTWSSTAPTPSPGPSAPAR